MTQMTLEWHGCRHWTVIASSQSARHMPGSDLQSPLAGWAGATGGRADRERHSETPLPPACCLGSVAPSVTSGHPCAPGSRSAE